MGDDGAKIRDRNVPSDDERWGQEQLPPRRLQVLPLPAARRFPDGTRRERGRGSGAEGGPAPSRSTASAEQPNGGGAAGASGPAAGKSDAGFGSDARNAASGLSGSRNRNALTMGGLHRDEPRTTRRKQAPCHNARKCNLLPPSGFFNVT
jgi:hypothetical protein